MNKPVIVVKDNLLMPILATESRVNEIKKELDSDSSHAVILNGLFLMLVSYIESLQKEVLIYYLKYHPEEITKKKTLEIEKDVLVDDENFHLVGSLVSRYIDKLPGWQFTEIFYDVLKIRKPKNDLNITMENIKKKRNELIHKNLKVDFKHKMINTDNHIDHDYLMSCLNNYKNYLNHLKSEIRRRYRKHTKIHALMNLWHYTFRTPLCSNFEDYWYIDIEKDSILGYKKSKCESNLSHSETFMLGIWRSQVSGYKVDFINMASLDSEMQDRLYMFIKLANDIFLY